MRLGAQMESIWPSNHHQRYETLRGEVRTDVSVAGAGVAGLTAAYLLSAAGVRVAVLEAGTIGSGVPGRGAAMVTAQQGACFSSMIRRFGQDRAFAIAHANQDAVHLIAGIASAEGIPCGLAVQDSFLYTASARGVPLVEREAEAARQLGFAADVTKAAPFFLPYVVASRLGNQLVLNPAEYMSALAAAIGRNGGLIYENSPVYEMEDGVLRTNGGSIRSKCVLVTTGLPLLCQAKYGSLRVYRQTGWAASVDAVAPVVGMWQDACDGLSFCTAGSRLMLSAGGGVRPPSMEAFLRRVAGCLPGASPAVWPIPTVRTLDGLPDVGKYASDGSCLFLATGFGRWGFTSGTVAGRILSDLVLDRPNAMIEIFSPQRLPGPSAIGGALALGFARCWSFVVSSLFRRKSAL